MYIEPNTTIRILQNVPLDNGYKHTIYFSTKEKQEEYFFGKTKFTLTKQSYQRVERGMMKVEIPAESLYNCNYLMFKNTNFGEQPNNRWFYAFITGVEYINNAVSQITFELDVMQTWFFDVTLLESFVEREHSKTDVVGENIIPEPLPIGDYYMGVPVGTGLFDVYDSVIVSPYTYATDEVIQPWNKNVRLKNIDGNPTILNYQAFNSTNDDDTSVPGNSFLATALTQHPSENDIVCVYQCPHSFIDYPSYTPHTTNLGYADEKYYIHTFRTAHPTKLAGDYEPINKKLLTYPYNKLVIDTADGNLYDYRYEFFKIFRDERGDLYQKIEFKIEGYRGINISFRAVPRFYKDEVENYTEGCLLTDFPNVGFVTDSFKAWIAQNKTRLAVQTVGTIAGLGSGLGSVMAGSQMLTPKTQVLSKAGARMMASGYDQIGGGVKSVIGTIAEGADKSALRYHPRVGSNDGSLEITWGKKDFTAIQYSINPQEAKVIDDFFSTYGYAVRTLKIPNRNVRPHWTYTKTVDCNVEGNAPADDVSRICSIYDAGITFWRNGDEVGNYSLNNQPT